LAYTNATVRFWSHMSLNTSFPKACAAGHSLDSFPTRRSSDLALLSMTVIVWLQVTELVCASVAVQVRCVLLTSLPLTPRLASTNVRNSILPHVWHDTGAPKAGVAGH